MPEPVDVERVRQHGLSFDELMSMPMDDLARLAHLVREQEAEQAAQAALALQELWRRLLARQDRLEAKLDALTKALKAGAIGRWQ